MKGAATGEGSFCVVFSNPVRAVEWAFAVQNQLLQVDWPQVCTRYRTS